jgi:Fe-Mn family superoxide dismutase
MSFNLAPLPYDFNALNPAIDAQTVELHYTKHHNGYLNNLNSALEKYPELFEKNVEEILSDLSQIPMEIKTAVRNNGGGFYNHTIYWSILSPNSQSTPLPGLASAIESHFGDFQTFKSKFETAGLGRFGSGWVWLSKKPSQELVLHTTPNQDTPLALGLIPIIGIDVWEHAYYLKYQNKRGEYLSNIWEILNWEQAEKNFMK